MRKLLFLALLLSVPALAQTFPSKPVRLVVPLVPGGNQDIVARAVAEEMSKGLGQQIVVENRPGQSAIIGTQFVKSSPADGYTLLLCSVANAISACALPLYVTCNSLTPVMRMNISAATWPVEPLPELP